MFMDSLSLLDTSNKTRPTNSLAANAAILVLTTILLGLRIISRSLLKSTWGWDDFLLLPAWTSLVGACGISYGKKVSHLPHHFHNY